MIKVISFDCFGVLMNDGWVAFLQKYGTEGNKQELRDLNARSDRGMIEYRDYLQQVSEITNAEVAEIHRMITTSLHMNEPLFEIIEKLKENYVIGLISNVGQTLDHYLPQGALDVFDVITVSSEVGVLKPDPRIYEIHLQKLGISAEECIFIDDREVNVTAATDCGITGIHFTANDKLIEDLRSLHIKVS